MKALNVFIFLIILNACSNSRVSEEKDDDTTSTLMNVDSSTYIEQKVQLTDKLNQLSDSIDTVMVKIRADSASFTNLNYQDMMQKLAFTKDRVERDLLEVNTTALNGWDEDYINRIELNTDRNRRELDNVLQQLQNE